MKRLVIALAAAMLAMPAQAALVGFYKFNVAGNLGLDSSGLGNDLLNFGATQTVGRSGGGLGLDGDGFLSTLDGEVPAQFPLGSSSYTISADFRTTDTGDGGIVGWGSYFDANRVNALRLHEGNGFRHYWWDNDLDVVAMTSNDAWHNVRVTFDGTTRKLFFNGVLAGSDTPGIPNVLNVNFSIGKTFASEFFIGTLDNVKIYNSAVAPGPVPEPSTWALLVVGFGLVGSALRRRSAPTAA